MNQLLELKPSASAEKLKMEFESLNLLQENTGKKSSFCNPQTEHSSYPQDIKGENS
jgi:hypothetical protein